MKSEVTGEEREVIDRHLPVQHVVVEMSHEMASTRKFVFYAVGIFMCYFYFGIIQERITRSKYGDSGEIFTCSLALVFIMCFVNGLFAKFLLSTFMKQGEDHTKTWYYASASLSYIGAMVASTTALQYVNYPTQVIGKSCKPIPTMVLGVLIGHKRYSLLKYLFVMMIVIGVCIFMYKDKMSQSQSTGPYLGMGEILLLVSLGLDGFTGGFQERMRSEYQTKSCHMMFHMNLWSVYILVPTIFFTGELYHFIEFVQRYPYVLSNIFIFSLLSALGQMFIFLMVSEFGALSCSIVTTTRKFFTFLGSVLIFGNTLSQQQWLGTALVFIGLTLDTVYGKNKGEKKMS